MNKAAILTGCILLLASTVITEFAGIKQKKHARSDQAALLSTTTANNKFSLSLYKSVSSNNTEESMIMSPVSLQVALALTYLGARGNTAKQMAAALHLPDDQNAVKAGFRHMLFALKSSGTTTLEVANRLYLQANFNVLKDFRRAARKSFGSDAKEVNFVKNAEKARKIINNWVEKRTRQKITQMIGPGVLNVMTRLVLVNAVYFKANWLQPFNTDDTKIEKFNINRNEQKDISMMHMKTFFGFKHLENLDAKILELPYEGESASMFIMLPKEVDGVSNLETKLSTIDLATIFNDMQLEELKIALPKFKIETSLDLKSNLMDLGLKDMFQKESADFSGITGNTDLYVSHVLQKAFVEVTELGTEAGASSAVVAEARSWRPPPLEFVVDHPFIFVLWEKKLNTTLFMGRFSGPQ